MRASAAHVQAIVDTARRLGFVTIGQMVSALVLAVEDPPAPRTQRIVDVAGIRAATLRTGG